jgi:two-component system phosphate regulon sensor histidine kinase PhoR
VYLVLDACGTGIVVLDQNAAVRYLNPAAARTLEVQSEVAIHRSAIAVLRDHTLHQAILESVRTGTPRSTSLAAPGGRTYSVSIMPLQGSGDWTVACFLEDVTELRRLETVRRDFVSNVSHELRTPLASIKAVVETLQGGALEDAEVAHDFLEQVNGEVDRLAQLVEELLDLGRIESGTVPLQLARVDPDELARGCVRRMTQQAERARVALTAQVGLGAPAIRADPDRLERALVNLVHNAIKFTPAGGSVVVRSTPAGHAAEISVQDTGVGISPVDLPRIFERFYKADRARGAPGTGLGLAITRHVVEGHGGNVTAQSALGQGSTFTVRLPAADTGSLTAG